ncbi:MAG: type II toxin-antitoxin system RelE/ParE family toxin [Eggerthellaceae bacterium]|nr:type II toxin-antitoxin system RelE/ParE family toxin [Eggerthellaceae bacterium]
MAYRVMYSSKALKKLKKMDRFDAALITSWVGKHLEGVDDPRRMGKALVGSHAGEWRYRVGDYRLLCVIQDDVLVIEVITIGHRRDVYR